MPHSKQAKKRVRQNRRRRMHNKAKKSAIRTLTKRFLKAAQVGDVALAEAEYRIVQKKLDKAAKTHAIHRNAAARRKSRLAKVLQQLKAEQPGA